MSPLRHAGPLLLALAVAGCGGDVGGAPIPTADASGPATDGGANGADAAAENDASTGSSDAQATMRGAPYPIVFVHGMAGFDTLRPLGATIQYWGDVVDDLRSRGETVFNVTVPPYDSSEARSRALETQLLAIRAQTGAAKLNLIAHSQGGLDARLLVSPNGLQWGDRVQTLVTVSTPHRGTKVADVVAGVGDVLPTAVADGVFEGLAKALQVTVYDLKNDPHLRAQLNELSVEHTTKVFNPKYIDDPRVRYLSWAGRSNLRPGIGICDGATFPNKPAKLDVLNPLLATVVAATEWGLPPKASDGLVTVESAKWGTFQGCVPADHLDEIGAQDVNGIDLTIFDYPAFYRDIVAELRAHGD